jgi:hypothetical protein
MMEIIAYAVLWLIGLYVVGWVTLMLSLMKRGGLETIPAALGAAAVVCAGYIGATVWWMHP